MCKSETQDRPRASSPNLLGPQLQLWSQTPQYLPRLWPYCFRRNNNCCSLDGCFRKILKQSSIKDVGWFWQGCTWMLTPPPTPQLPKCENYSWQSGWPVTNLTLPHTPSPPAQEWPVTNLTLLHTPSPPAQRMGASGPCLPLPSTEWATQTRFISPVLLLARCQTERQQKLAGHFPTLLIPDRMCILWIPKSWPRDITSIPAKAICYSLLF